MAQVFQLAGEVRTAAISFAVVVSSGFTFLRDVNGALILDANGTPIPVLS